MRIMTEMCTRFTSDDQVLGLCRMAGVARHEWRSGVSAGAIMPRAERPFPVRPLEKTPAPREARLMSATTSAGILTGVNDAGSGASNSQGSSV